MSDLQTIVFFPAVSARRKANPSTTRAADLIERVARTGQPVAREAGEA